MITAAFLVLYSLTVLLFAPRILRRITRGGDAPRLGVAAWLTAIATVLMTWVVAAGFFLIDVARHWNHPELVLLSCMDRLHSASAGHDGAAPQVVAILLAAAVASTVIATGARLARAVARLRVLAHRHADAVRLVGHSTAERDVVVIKAAKPAAYCVSGRPPAIVLTTAALAALNEHELRAVVAHERAHLAARHPNVVAALRSLATVFPRLRLMTDGVAEVSRLLEMCADDAAARRHGTAALLSGMMALVGPVPSGALAAADVAVLMRAERLTTPPAHRTQTRASATLTSAVTMMVAGPVITIALVASGPLMCGL